MLLDICGWAFVWVLSGVESGLGGGAVATGTPSTSQLCPKVAALLLQRPVPKVLVEIVSGPVTPIPCWEQLGLRGNCHLPRGGTLWAALESPQH